MDDIGAVATSEIETAVVEDAEREEADKVVVTATIPAEYVAPAEPTTAAGDSVEAPTGKIHRAFVETMTEPVEPEEPVAVDDVAAVLTREIEPEFVDDTESKQDALVVEASMPTEDSAPIEPASAAADSPATVTVDDVATAVGEEPEPCLLYTSPSPRDGLLSRMPSSA